MLTHTVRSISTLCTTLLFVGVACGDASDLSDATNTPTTSIPTTSTPTTTTPANTPTPDLPTLHTPDPERAQRGLTYLQSGSFGPGLIPRLALRHIYLTWPGSLAVKARFFNNEAAFWEAFRARYGFETAPWDNRGLPLGLRPGTQNNVAVDCLMCHAGRIPGGAVTIGIANTRLDLEGLHDDLQRLPQTLQELRDSNLPEPYATLLNSIQIPETVSPITQLDQTTAAAGIGDGFGLGVAFGFDLFNADPTLHRTYGFQDPPPWFTQRTRSHMYTDASVPAGAHRTMMATLLASGMTWSEIIALDSTFKDVSHTLWTLPNPRWQDIRSEPLDPEQTKAGRTIYQAQCSTCHGTYEPPNAHFPNRVIPIDEIGTDPTRAAHLGPPEADAINTLMADPSSPMTPTGGYLAPPLLGIWATPPYLHNGSIPTLHALLTPSERPTFWSRPHTNTPEDYNPQHVGWSFTTHDTPGDPTTPEGRTIYNTTLPGLSNAGHTFGQHLSEDERTHLLTYLKTL